MALVAVVGAILACMLIIGVSPGSTAVKEPIKVGAVGDITSSTQSFKDAITAVELRVKAINAAGGINGRKIQLVKCDSKADPNVGGQCAQQMVAEKVVVVANPFTTAAAAMMPVWNNAKLASVGNPVTPTQFTDRYAYNIDVGAAAAYGAAGAYAAQAGCKKGGVIASAIGAYQGAASYAKQAFAWRGGRIVSSQSPPPGTPDYTPYVQAALNAGAECLLYVVPNTDTAKLLTVVKQSSKPSIPVIGTVSAYSGQLGTLGSLANGLVGLSGLSLDTDWKGPRADRRKYAPNTPLNNYYGEGWGTMKTIETALRAIKGSITKASVVKALDTVPRIDPGVHGPFNFRGLPLSNATFARLAVRTVYAYRVSGGKQKEVATIKVDRILAKLK